jgi:arabinogalactan oligomer/maltooligosaccharide transport system substrate-binding protein
MKREMISVAFDKIQWKVVGLIGAFIMMASCQSIGIEPSATATVQVTSTATPVPSPTLTITPAEPTPTKLPDVQGEVSLWLDWTQKELEVLYPHLEVFHEMFPEIQISVSFYPSDELLDRFRAAVLEGKEPTILLGPTDWSEQLRQDGSIRDIHGRMTEDVLELFHPVALEGVSFNQSIYGLPLSMEGILLYRNRSLVSESPDTVDELVSLTQELDGEGLVGIQLDLGFLQTGAFLQACDGELLDANGELSLTLKAGECWLKILQQLRLAGNVTVNTDDDLQIFEAGQAAWLIDGSWNSARIMEALGAEQVAFDPWPVYSPTEKVLNGYAWSRNVYFSASAQEQDFNAAWILARYLLTPEVQVDFALSTFGQHVPVLKSVPTQERWLQELITAMGMNIPLPRFPELRIFIEHLEIAAVDVARRGYDPYFVIRWEHLNIEKALRYARTGTD